MKNVIWLVAKPHKDLEPIQFNPTLKNMQNMVGGWIEFVYPFEDMDDDSLEAFCVVNEEGKIIGLEPNRPIMDEKGEVIDIMHGTVLIGFGKRDDKGNYDYVDVPIDFARKLIKQPTWFHSCYYIFVNGKIRAVPEVEGGENNEKVN